MPNIGLTLGMVSDLEMDLIPEFGNEILFLFSDPLVDTSGKFTGSQYGQLGIDNEIHALLDAFSYSPTQFQLNIEPAAPDRIRATFSRERMPVIIHFSGHGEQFVDDSTALIGENALGEAKQISAASFLRMIDTRIPCQLAFLNCCHSEQLGSLLIERGVHHVIAVNTEDQVLDYACLVFSEHLYPKLLNGSSVQAAFEYAQNAVYDDPSVRHLVGSHGGGLARERSKFKLLPITSLEHKRSLIINGNPGEMDNPAGTETNLPDSKQSCVGRESDIYTVLKLFGVKPKGRVVGLHGLGGMGKTRLAIAIGKWFHVRARWAGGVWYYDLRNVTSANDASITIGAIKPHALYILDDIDILVGGGNTDINNLIDAILAVSGTCVLTTSRQGLPGEIFYSSHDLGSLNPTASLAMFTEFAPPVTNWGDKSDIVDDLKAINKILDGYPFPIRLAATYMRKTRCSLSDLRQSLEKELLETLAYPYEPQTRNTSLRKTLDISLNALPSATKELFHTLAIFPAGITARACRAIIFPQATPVLGSLVQFSVVELVTTGVEKRWRLPEPAREYAAQIREPLIGELLALYGMKALSYYHDFVQKHLSRILKGFHDAIVALIEEQPNLDKFLSWGLEHETKDGWCNSARIVAMLVESWLSIGEKSTAKMLNLLERGLNAAERVGDKYSEAMVLRRESDVQLLCSKQESETQEPKIKVIASYENIALEKLQKAGTIFLGLKEWKELGFVRVQTANVLQKKGKMNEANREFELAIEAFRNAASSHEVRKYSEIRGNVLMLIAYKIKLSNSKRRAPLFLEAASCFVASGTKEKEGHARRLGGRSFVRAGKQDEGQKEISVANELFSACKLWGESAKVCMLLGKINENIGNVPMARIAYKHAKRAFDHELKRVQGIHFGEVVGATQSERKLQKIRFDKERKAQIKRLQDRLTHLHECIESLKQAGL